MQLPICKATTADVHGELQTIAREKTRRIQGERRDQRTPKNTRNSLSGAFKYAVNKRVIPTNPVYGVITPRGVRPKKTHANTLNEIYALLAALKDEPAHTACLTVALSRLSQRRIGCTQVGGHRRRRDSCAASNLVELVVLTRKSLRQSYATRTFVPRGIFISKLKARLRRRRRRVSGRLMLRARSSDG